MKKYLMHISKFQKATKSC